MISRAQHTERLKLVPAHWGHVGFVFRLIGDADVRRYLGGPVPLRHRLGAFRRYLDTRPQEAIWVVQTRHTGKRIGLVSISGYRDSGEVELSYQFRPEASGHGFATEAARSVLAAAFTELGHGQVFAETQAANVASCRLLGRLGFSEHARIDRFGTEQIVFVLTAAGFHAA